MDACIREVNRPYVVVSDKFECGLEQSRRLLPQVEPRVIFLILFDQVQVEMVFSSPVDGDVERHDLFLDLNVLLEFILDDVCRDLADDLLQCDVALEGLIEVLLEEGLADRQASEVENLELLVNGQSVA